MHPCNCKIKYPKPPEVLGFTDLIRSSSENVVLTPRSSRGSKDRTACAVTDGAGMSLGSWTNGPQVVWMSRELRPAVLETPAPPNQNNFFTSLDKKA